jgi:hypothetical protein
MASTDSSASLQPAVAPTPDPNINDLRALRDDARPHFNVKKKLLFLAGACGYKYFVANTFAENVRLEREAGDGVRKILREVILLQREAAIWLSLAKYRTKEEKRFHHEYMRLSRYVFIRMGTTIGANSQTE